VQAPAADVHGQHNGCRDRSVGHVAALFVFESRVSKEKSLECREAGKAIRLLLERDLKPRDIMTSKAFENAVTIVMALGGSTNAVLHLIAMAKAVGLKLTQEDFQRISDKTPLMLT